MTVQPRSSVLDRVLVFEMVRVTEAAAIAASRLIGRGDEKAADQAAVDAMRTRSTLPIDGHRGDRRGRARRGADALYRREGRHRRGTGPKIDIALDPLEGTTITAKACPTRSPSSRSPSTAAAQRARRLHGQDRGRPRLSRRRRRSRQVAFRESQRLAKAKGVAPSTKSSSACSTARAIPKS
jgi:hypothetical protein